jgi:hypothetical protein
MDRQLLSPYLAQSIHEAEHRQREARARAIQAADGTTPPDSVGLLRRSLGAVLVWGGRRLGGEGV